MKKAIAIEFEDLLPQLMSLYEELQQLTKKSPNDLLNKFKLGLVNALLTRANGILDTDERPFQGFSTFDENSIPSNSDVVIILSQYVAKLRQFKSANTHYANGRWHWRIDGKASMETTAPMKLH